MIETIIAPHRRLLLLCLAISLALYMVSAWHSAIYLHPDEHYQIVEFASYKMGITHADQLAWEFAEQIRPGTQPLLCYTLLKTCGAAHITDHYSQLFLLRVLSAFLSLFAATLLCITALPYVRAQYRRTFIIASFLFWYPYVYGVHFSSETWSACMVMIAISILVWQYEGNRIRSAVSFFLAGLLLGLAFLFRFQTAVISAGIVAWLFTIGRERKLLLYLISGGAILLTLGTLADHWLYGEWVFVPWRYFDAAFIHKHADFGDQPIYFFPEHCLMMLTPPIGILVLIALPVAFITQSRSIYTWALLPFLVLHILIPHKEWRFFYPIISFLPLLGILAWQGWRERSWLMPRPLLSVAKWGIAIGDLVALLLFVILADLRFDQKILMQAVHEYALTHPVMLYETDITHSPFVLPKATIPKDLYPEYVRDSNVHEAVVASLQEIPTHGGDTLTLVSASEEEWGSRPGTILYQTWPGSTASHRMLGAELYRQISSNNYYLIRVGPQSR